MTLQHPNQSEQEKSTAVQIDSPSGISGGVDWSLLYEHRKSIEKRFGKIWALPLKKRHHHIVREYLADGLSWLEVGAGKRGLKSIVEEGGSNVRYKSYDIDQRNFHDFYQLDDISGSYDCICIFEVIEHVTLEEGQRILQKCLSVLKPDGTLIISTPNIYYPPAFMRDVTHITAWAYDELGGFLQLNGFVVEHIYRMYHDAFLRKIVTRYLMRPIHKLMGIDYSKQIIIVASK